MLSLVVGSSRASLSKGKGVRSEGTVAAGFVEVVSSYWCGGVRPSWHEGKVGRTTCGVDVRGRWSRSPYSLLPHPLLLRVMSSGTGRREALACGVERSPEEYECRVLPSQASSAVGTVAMTGMGVGARPRLNGARTTPGISPCARSTRLVEMTGGGKARFGDTAGDPGDAGLGLRRPLVAIASLLTSSPLTSPCHVERNWPARSAGLWSRDIP